MTGNSVQSAHWRENRMDKGVGIRKKARLTEKCCNACGGRLNTWDLRLSKTLAYKNPICEACIAEEYGMDVEYLRKRMEDFFGMRPCQGI